MRVAELARRATHRLTHALLACTTQAEVVSTRVQLLHRPTGLRVKCQEDRSQAINRYLARRLLLDKIEAQILGKKSQEQQAHEKIRRQKRRRSRRAKEKMLANKHHQSEKKSFRKVSGRDWGE